MTNEQYIELAELAGGFIHEIKNHLSTLKLNLQLLGEEFADPQSQRERRALERTRRLETECEHLLDVSNDFLRFARLKDLDLRPGDLSEALAELIDFFGPMARAHNIEIKTFLPGDLPLVAMDRAVAPPAAEHGGSGPLHPPLPVEETRLWHDVEDMLTQHVENLRYRDQD